MGTIEEQRELFKTIIKDSLAIGRPEDVTKSMFAFGYGDLATDDIFHMIEEAYRGTPMEGVTTYPRLSKPVDPPIMEEVRDWILSGSGIFTSVQLDREFGFIDRAARKQRAKYLMRLREEGLIYAVPDKRETFQISQQLPERLKYVKPGEGVKVLLPLGLHKLVKLFPGNIVIVAGSPNAGKTAFLLNVMMDNLGIHKVHYFSSEMGREELSLRILGFPHINDPNTIFDMAHIYECTEQIEDLIVPGKGNLNIIDYLEVGDNFWQVSGILRRIWAKLDGALAFVALQKARGALLGRGAEFSEEKARLYVSINQGTIRIVKAKTWRDPRDNPNGKQHQFSLVNGCEFIQGRMGWHHTS